MRPNLYGMIGSLYVLAYPVGVAAGVVWVFSGKLGLRRYNKVREAAWARQGNRPRVVDAVAWLPPLSDPLVQADETLRLHIVLRRVSLVVMLCSLGFTVLCRLAGWVS